MGKSNFQNKDLGDILFLLLYNWFNDFADGQPVCNLENFTTCEQVSISPC